MTEKAAVEVPAPVSGNETGGVLSTNGAPGGQGARVGEECRVETQPKTLRGAGPAAPGRKSATLAAAGGGAGRDGGDDVRRAVTARTPDCADTERVATSRPIRRRRARGRDRPCGRLTARNPTGGSLPRDLEDLVTSRGPGGEPQRRSLRAAPKEMPAAGLPRRASPERRHRRDSR